MTWRDTTLDGVPVRVARVSFSGELAFEVNVNRVARARGVGAAAGRGRALRHHPYGTETMHVLRAEKGYPIIGQDTDGTVTPHDLGMAWAVSKKKPDFIGKRSFSRAENQNPLRKQLVGLLPVDRSPDCRRARRSSSSARTTRCRRHRFRCSGHVTSSYRSAELGRTVRALALVKAGQSRIGETLHVPGRRDPGARGGHRLRCWSTRKERAAMADTLERTSPLQPWAARFARLPIRLTIVEEPFVTMVDLRVDPSGPGAATAAELLGVRAADHPVHLRRKR